MNAPVRTNKAMPAESAEEAPPGVDAGLPVDGALTTPREVVIYCEGFGAGPGGGWFLELTFLALNEGGFSVFLRCDGTLDDELVEDAEVDELFDDDGDSYEEVRAVRIATVNRHLTWRRALRFARGLDSIRLGGDDASEVRVSGVEVWQEAVLSHGLLRNAGGANLSKFFSDLPDGDLLELHRRLGGLLSEKASKVLPGLAKALRGTDLRRKSLRQLAAIVGVEDPWNLRGLTVAVALYRPERAEQ